MPKDFSRPTLPASSSDFSLPSSIASTSSFTLDDTNFVLHRFRRQSLLAPKAVLHSPLQASFTLHPSPPKRKARTDDEELELYRERSLSDSSPSGSSENPTPPLVPHNSEEELGSKHKRAKSISSTPPRKFSSSDEALHRHSKRRLSYPLKQPRIFDMIATESRPAEAEFKSEAAFQRLLASGTDLPLHPRTPRAPSDRGRYPEEAGDESQHEDDTLSDDEDGDEFISSYASSVSGTVSDPIPISKRHTPTSSVNGDDLYCMSISGSPSLSSTPMDIDMTSPSILSTPINQWRHTPPPTSSVIRPGKRKLEDRFDPYPAAKRRAVSPSVSYLRDTHPHNHNHSHSHSSLSSPISRNAPRLPISIPVAAPSSTVTSAASSPTIGNAYPSFTRPVPMTSSPTLLASMNLSSPILRPLGRHGRREDEREIDGAGDGVRGLSLDAS